MSTAFQHQHAAHCESGVVASLLSHHGLPISEAMTFGLASALSFAWLPFIKVNGQPLIAYRMPPKSILKGLRKPLGLRMRFETFRSPEKGRRRLDELLAQDRVAGLQTSVYWLPYFPEELRFHFNAHNLIVYGREGEEYQVSDPVGDHPVRCASADLQKARFAKGVLAPKGLLYYVEQAPTLSSLAPRWRGIVMAAIRKTCRIMLHTPLPIIGTRGIHRMAKAVRGLKLRDDHDERAAKLFIGHIVRMQEEIGTGGGGFRFLYAAFLQEAADLADLPVLRPLADEMLSIGDAWREFALASARMLRGREPLTPSRLADLLDTISVRERAFFQSLDRAVRTTPT
jgi:hypothetical protein